MVSDIMSTEKQMRRKKVGIMGGTFDPIHTGHLILAEAAWEKFDLDYVLVMPNGNPPHKPGQVQTSYEDRITMTGLAIENNEHLVLSDFEKTPQDYHYTYQTLQYLTSENPDTDYFFILGADSLFSFEQWVEPGIISRYCTILAATRDGLSYDDLEKQIEHLHETLGTVVYTLDTPNIDISSSMIRDRVSQNLSVRYYVPDSVDTYIREKGLYKAETFSGEEA